MSNIDTFCGRINPHPFPNDYNFDQESQMDKALERFFNPMGMWGELEFNPFAYDEPGQAHQKFINYFIDAYDNPNKHARMTALFVKHLSDDELKFTLNDLHKENSNIIKDLMSLIDANKSTDGLLDLIGDNPTEKLNRLIKFIDNSGFYGKERAIGGAIEQTNKKLGYAAVAGRLLIGDVPGAAIDAIASLIGTKAGRSIDKLAYSTEAKERFMAHMKHYILEDKIKFDEFAEIIFSGTSIKKDDLTVIQNNTLESDVGKRVVAIIASQLGVKEELSVDAEFVNDLGADSLDTVETKMPKK